MDTIEIRVDDISVVVQGDGPRVIEAVNRIVRALMGMGRHGTSLKGVGGDTGKRANSGIEDGLEEGARHFSDDSPISIDQPAMLRIHAEPGAAEAELPIEAYTNAILVLLSELGGKADVGTVAHRVGERLGGDFNPSDLTMTDSGVPKWRARLKWAREKLARNGMLDRHRTPGVWVLSEDGAREAARLSEELNEQLS